MLLTTMLSWDQQSQLAALAPATLTTAAGRTVAIDYDRDRPTVSVRVQDMFGTRVHPTVAGGVPLTIELLSPADRPIQITADLPGLLGGLVGDGPQGPRRPLPEAPLAGRPVGGRTETVEGPPAGLTRRLPGFHATAYKRGALFCSHREPGSRSDSRAERDVATSVVSPQ